MKQNEEEILKKLRDMKKELAKKQRRLEKVKRAARVKAHVRQKIKEHEDQEKQQAIEQMTESRDAAPRSSDLLNAVGNSAFDQMEKSHRQISKTSPTSHCKEHLDTSNSATVPITVSTLFTTKHVMECQMERENATLPSTKSSAAVTNNNNNDGVTHKGLFEDETVECEECSNDIQSKILDICTQGKEAVCQSEIHRGKSCKTNLSGAAEKEGCGSVSSKCTDFINSEKTVSDKFLPLQLHKPGKDVSENSTDKGSISGKKANSKEVCDMGHIKEKTQATFTSCSTLRLKTKHGKTKHMISHNSELKNEYSLNSKHTSWFDADDFKQSVTSSRPGNLRRQSRGSSKPEQIGSVLNKTGWLSASKSHVVDMHHQKNKQRHSKCEGSLTSTISEIIPSNTEKESYTKSLPDQKVLKKDERECSITVQEQASLKTVRSPNTFVELPDENMELENKMIAMKKDSKISAPQVLNLDNNHEINMMRTGVIEKLSQSHNSNQILDKNTQCCYRASITYSVKDKSVANEAGSPNYALNKICDSENNDQVCISSCGNNEKQVNAMEDEINTNKTNVANSKTVGDIPNQCNVSSSHQETQIVDDPRASESHTTGDGKVNSTSSESDDDIVKASQLSGKKSSQCLALEKKSLPCKKDDSGASLSLTPSFRMLSGPCKSGIGHLDQTVGVNMSTLDSVTDSEFFNILGVSQENQEGEKSEQNVNEEFVFLQSGSEGVEMEDAESKKDIQRLQSFCGNENNNANSAAVSMKNRKSELPRESFELPNQHDTVGKYNVLKLTKSVPEEPPNTVTDSEHPKSTEAFTEYTELDAIPYSQFELTEDFLSGNVFSSKSDFGCRGAKKRFSGALVKRRSPRISSFVASDSDSMGSVSSHSSSAVKNSGALESKVTTIRSKKRQSLVQQRKSAAILSIFQFLIDEAKKSDTTKVFELPAVFDILKNNKLNSFPSQQPCSNHAFTEEAKPEYASTDNRWGMTHESFCGNNNFVTLGDGVEEHEYHSVVQEGPATKEPAGSSTNCLINECDKYKSDSEEISAVLNPLYVYDHNVKSSTEYHQNCTVNQQDTNDSLMGQLEPRKDMGTGFKNANRTSNALVIPEVNDLIPPNEASGRTQGDTSLSVKNTADGLKFSEREESTDISAKDECRDEKFNNPHCEKIVIDSSPYKSVAQAAQTTVAAKEDGNLKNTFASTQVLKGDQVEELPSVKCNRILHTPPSAVSHSYRQSKFPPTASPSTPVSSRRKPKVGIKFGRKLFGLKLGRSVAERNLYAAGYSGCDDCRNVQSGSGETQNTSKHFVTNLNHVGDSRSLETANSLQSHRVVNSDYPKGVLTPHSKAHSCKADNSKSPSFVFETLRSPTTQYPDVVEAQDLPFSLRSAKVVISKYNQISSPTTMTPTSTANSPELKAACLVSPLTPTIEIPSPVEPSSSSRGRISFTSTPKTANTSRLNHIVSKLDFNSPLLNQSKNASTDLFPANERFEGMSSGGFDHPPLQADEELASVDSKTACQKITTEVGNSENLSQILSSEESYLSPGQMKVCTADLSVGSSPAPNACINSCLHNDTTQISFLVSNSHMIDDTSISPLASPTTVITPWKKVPKTPTSPVQVLEEENSRDPQRMFVFTPSRPRPEPKSSTVRHKRAGKKNVWTFSGCFQSNSQDAVISILSGTIMTSEKEKKQFIVSVHATSLTLWTTDDQGGWTPELDWRLAPEIHIMQACLMPRTDIIAVAASGWDGKQIFVTLFIYDWNTEDTLRYNIPGLDQCPEIRAPTDVELSPYSASELHIGLTTDTHHTVVKVCLSECLRTVLATSSFGVHLGKLVSLAAVTDQPSASISLTGDQRLTIWNTRLGAAVKKINLPLILPCLTQLLGAKAIKGFLILDVLWRVDDGDCGGTVVVNPLSGRAQQVLKLPVPNFTWRKVESAKKDKSLVTALSGRGSLGVWNCTNGTLLGYTKSTMSTSVSVMDQTENLIVGEIHGCLHIYNAPQRQY